MDTVSEAQRLKEEAEIRERDARRAQEKEEYERALAEAAAEEQRRRKEEELRHIEEQKRRKREAEEWKRLGSDAIQELPAVPPPIKLDSEPHAVESWHLDDETAKPVFCTLSLKPGRKPNTQPVKMKELRELGIVFFYINLNDFSVVKQLLKERDYKHTDEIRISQTCKDELLLERWYQEHYCDDEQIRLIIDGSTYIDVRSKQDKWIRIHLEAGHLIVIPAGLYHRCTLDEDDYVALFRAFHDAPRFVPVYRSDSRADSSKVRLNYLMNLKKGDVASELGFH